MSRSRCDHCGTILRPRDLVPLLSFAATRGRCRYCAQPIGWFCPAVELAALAVALMAVWLSAPETLVVNCVLGWTLLALAWIDARTYLLPDRLTLPLILGGLAVGGMIDGDLLSSVIGAVAGYGLIWVVEVSYRRLRGRAGIGLGDAKLLAAGGAWVGWQGLPSVLLVGTVSALVLVGLNTVLGRAARRDTAIPFGPFLALGIWLVRLFGPIGI